MAELGEPRKEIRIDPARLPIPSPVAPPPPTPVTPSPPASPEPQELPASR